MLGRRRRRSHFFLNQSLFSDILLTQSTESNDTSSFSGTASLLAGLGFIGITASAYSIFRSSSGQSEQEAIDELPGVVDDAISQSPSPSTPDLPKKEDTPSFSSPPAAKPVPSSFWATVKGYFSTSTPSTPSPIPASQVASGSRPTATPASLLSTTKLAPSYRSKFSFSNIANADSLSRKGSYTQEEASTIVSLKASSLSTAASSTMPAHIESLIIQYATKHGVDPSLAIKIAKMESGGNPNAISSTGAIGVYQFTGRTATEYGVSNRFDPSQNVEAGILLLAKNAKRLQSSNPNDSTSSIPATPVNLYLMHQLGASGARELILAANSNKKISQLSPSLQRAIKLNYGGSGKGSAVTAGEYIRVTESGLNRRSIGVQVANSNENTPVTPLGFPRTKSVTNVSAVVGSNANASGGTTRANQRSGGTSNVSNASVMTASVDSGSGINGSIKAMNKDQVNRAIGVKNRSGSSDGSPRVSSSGSSKVSSASKPSSNQVRSPQSVVRLKNGTLVAMQ